MGRGLGRGVRGACVPVRRASRPTRPHGRRGSGDADARGRPGETRAKGANGERGAVRARAVHRQAGAKAAARGGRLCPSCGTKSKTQLRGSEHRYVFRKSDAPVMIFDNKLTQWSEATLQYM